MEVITNDKIRALDEAVEKASKISIIAHANPDGDAFGSTIALKHYLKEKRKKKVQICIVNPCVTSLRFLYEKEDISSKFEDAPLVFLLDANSFDRTDYMYEPALASKAFKVLIDHHLDPSESEFDLVFSRQDVSSASEMLYQVLMAMPGIGSAADLPSLTNNALMTGMTTDTNNFANSVFPSTFRMASDLLAAGVNREQIISNLYSSYRRNRVDAISFMLHRKLKITRDGCAYMIMNESIRRRFDLQEGELEGLVNIPLSIKNVKMSIFLRQESGRFRVSIRSKAGYSANALAIKYFNGGGHEQAAGGRLYFPKDIRCKNDASSYIEKVVSEFL